MIDIKLYVYSEQFEQSTFKIYLRHAFENSAFLTAYWINLLYCVLTLAQLI